MNAREYESELAWVLWKGLVQMSDLLWDRYQEDFLEWARKERVNPPGTYPEEDLPEEDLEGDLVES